jgi:DNA-binding NarL/FixJ family response regulator
VLQVYDARGWQSCGTDGRNVTLRHDRTKGESLVTDYLKMRVRVAVWDPVPVYRRGLMAILSDVGLYVEGLEEPLDVVTWSTGADKHVALLTVDSPVSGEGWNAIAELVARESEPIVIALLTDCTLDSYLRAVASGATSAVARDAAPELIRQVFLEAIQGRTLLPTEAVLALVSRLGPMKISDRPSDQHLEWLRALSQGVSISELAERIGYSERAMYRLLKDLYSAIGAKNRTEALLKASRHGWLEGEHLG